MTEVLHAVRIICASQTLPAVTELLEGMTVPAPVVYEEADSDAVWLDIYFTSQLDAAVLMKVLNTWDDLTVEERVIGEEDWDAIWRRQFHAVDVGRRFRIVPEWERGHNSAPNRINLLISPGMSFGTGDHFTTRFCIEALEYITARQGAIRSMLDVGTGTGIIALAAARLGVPEVLGFDVDPQCLLDARAHAALNDVKNVAWAESDLASWPLDRAWNVVCANLYAELLLKHQARLEALAAPYLVVTGIRDFEADGVAEQFHLRGMREVQRDSNNEWAGFIFRKDD